MARWLSETVLVTQLEVKQGRWVIGNIGFTRHGQEHLTKLARDIIADFEKRFHLMDQWAAYMTGGSTKVVRLHG